MKTMIGAVCASLAVMALTPAQAWANPQHERMKRCNAEAREQALKGEERKAFMSTCLRGRHDASAAKAAPTGPAAEASAAGASAVGGGGEAGKAAVAATTTAAPAAASAAGAEAGSAAGAAMKAAAPAAPAATAAATPAQATLAAAGADASTREKACNQSATEQSLRGAKRKTFMAECLKG